MSSHREAPAISKDPVADNTDTYAFVSPANDATVTLISNYVPLEAPFGGPNFFEFGDDVLYYIYVDNNGDGVPDVTYEFEFQTQVLHPNSFLYNGGTIGSLTDPHWNRRQTYSVTEVKKGNRKVLGTKLPCPPCNIGPLSTPNYADLAASAVNPLGNGRTVFAGQRLEGFYVDLGSIFELGTLRPFQAAHIGSSVLNLPTGNGGVNASKDFNVHSIALQVPMSDLTRDGSTPMNAASSTSVIGVWAAAARRKARIYDGTGNGQDVDAGPWTQISRLGNPLINEVIIGMGQKDYWNTVTPADDGEFIGRYRHPELATLLPSLYPSPTFDHLDALNKSGAPRNDLVAILLTGIPSGLITGFQNYTGSQPGDMLRLNMAIPAVSMANASPLGVVGGDFAGFPNGRRVYDDVVTVELRAIAGLTYPLIKGSYKPDGAASAITDGLTDTDATYLDDTFPYLGTPMGGYQTAPLGALS